MNEETSIIQAQQPTQALAKKATVAVGNRGIVITDLDSMWRWSNYVAASGLAPKGIEKAEAIFVATQMGLEVGLTPMAALQNIAVINGRPSIWGDAQLAVVRSTGELEEFSEWYEVGGKKTERNPAQFDDGTTAVCRVKRRNYPAQESAFSVADAKKAGLWGKTGPWSQYPGRMLRFRARSFGLRDLFGDALRGMLTVEEAQDMPPMIDVTPKFAAPPPEQQAETPPEPEAPKPRTRRVKASQPVDVDPVSAAPTPEPAETQTAEQAGPEPDPAPEADPGPDSLTSTQGALYKLVAIELKTPFDVFRDTIVKTTWFPGSENWGGFSDVPDATAQKLINAKLGLAKKIEQFVAGQKGGPL